MHLCERCRDTQGDWPPPPVRPVPWVNPFDPRNARERQLAQRPPCPQCGERALPTANILLCGHCAYLLRQCQHCGESTIPRDERAMHETAKLARERALDLFTVAIKTYGYAEASKLLHADEVRKDFAHDTESSTALVIASRIFAPAKDAIAHALCHTMPEIERRISESRGGIYHLFGAYLSRTIVARCTDCRPPWHGRPRLCRADGCGHWTVGESAEWCLFCAMEVEQCAACGVSTAAPTE